MGVLDDSATIEAVDILLRANRIPSDDLMTILIQQGWSPSSEASTIVFAYALFVKRYNDARDDELDVMNSLAKAQAETLSHPSISNLIANNVGNAVDKAVGV